MDFKNHIEILEATTVNELQGKVNEYKQLLPITRDIIDVGFQVDKGKFYAALTIGELQKKNKDEKPKGKMGINVLGG